MSNFIDGRMTEKDDKMIESRKRVRVKIRVMGRTRKEITILRVVLVLLGSALAGVIIGIFLGNLLRHAIKNTPSRNQDPVAVAGPTPPESAPTPAPVLSPGLGN